ncbi:TlpA family protein disulfide reductase [Halobiforma nitratireducens]|uniref:TlpA family protein disulfide reductase n=1 Tax=Halobiforma nitratireducens TaxID=130048 RepID=UPI0006780BA0|nr:TlpA disulfide reductase family protein [Halobiforma nitratireducens]
MNRRELVAGLASVGVLGGGAVAWRVRSTVLGNDGSDRSDSDEHNDDDGEGDDEGDDASDGAVTLETIDAPGSDAGAVTIPTDGVSLVVFFSAVCHRCRSLMPNLVEAQAQLADDHGDAVTVVSVASHQTEEQLRDWWAEHDGDWTLAYDGDGTLGREYGVTRHPVLLAIDADGDVRWRDEGELETERIVDRVESVLEEPVETDDD